MAAGDPCPHLPAGCGMWRHPRTKEWQEPVGLREPGSSLVGHGPQPCTRGGCLGSTAGCRRTPRGTAQPAAPSAAHPLRSHFPMTPARGILLPLLELASAGEASISARPAAFTALSLSQTQQLFLGTTDLAGGLPWAEGNTFLRGWLAARRIKFVYFFSACYRKYSPCAASFHCLSCLTVRGHTHMLLFPTSAAASAICVQISSHRHSTEDRRAQAAVEKSWLAWRSPQLRASASTKSNFLHGHILCLIVTG